MQVKLSAVDDKHAKTKDVMVTCSNVWIVGNTVHVASNNWRYPYCYFKDGSWFLFRTDTPTPYTRIEIE